jgi:pyruvate/2-oxoglutarate dehydrogenase complex dihydrolipoamide acyltransferase (E2) component
MQSEFSGHKTFRLPKHRELLGTFSSLAPKHPIHVLVEVDATRARRIIREHKEATGETLSFMAWLIKCIAKTVEEHREVQAYRRGKELIVFDDVDVGFTIEERQEPGQPWVAGAIVRKANQKTFRQIHDEVRAAQGAKASHGAIVGESDEARRAGFLLSMPGPLRSLAVWFYRRDPFLRKRTQGTVGVSSVGNVLGTTSGMWGFPIVSGPYPLELGIGGISIKPGVIGDRIESREYLPISVMFDHDAVDGADAARFLRRLGELLQLGYGLDGFVPLEGKHLPEDR